MNSKRKIRESRSNRFSKLEMTAPNFKLNKTQLKKKNNLSIREHKSLDEIDVQKEVSGKDLEKINKVKIEEIKLQERMSREARDLKKESEKNKKSLFRNIKSSDDTISIEDEIYSNSSEEYKRVMYHRKKIISEINNMHKENKDINTSDAVIKIIIGISLLVLGVFFIQKVHVSDFFKYLTSLIFITLFFNFARSLKK